MKFGLVYYKKTDNLGDDVQSYAVSRFLPQIDYFVDREHISEFTSKDNEPVAIIMAAWWMHNPLYFPPPAQIFPKCISIHLSRDVLTQGIVGSWFRTFSPVGARDQHTLQMLKNANIPAYFSGCVTLTLPKQPKINIEREYFVVSDVKIDVARKLIPTLSAYKDDLDIMYLPRFFKFKSEYDGSWERKKAVIEEDLIILQNAKCVITNRLHVALPCLAMGVPVFVIASKDDIRFSGLANLLHMASVEEFLGDEYEYDFLNPPDNKQDYLDIRNNLIAQLNEFVSMASKLEEIPIDLPFSDAQRHLFKTEYLLSDIRDRVAILGHIAAKELKNYNT